MSQKRSVLMICLGNICRSPIAEAIFLNQINKMGINHLWDVDSAALIDYHVGKGPDKRAMAILKNRGITNYSHRVRRITEDDFYKYDWIFGMDNENMRQLQSMQPADSKAKVEPLGKYDPKGELIIRDPYYDNNTLGFEAVYEQCARCIEAFLNVNKDDIS